MVVRKITTERDQKRSRGDVFYLRIPIGREEIASAESPTVEKTALFVPKDKLFRLAEFCPSSFSEQVFVTRNTYGVLEAVFKYGDVALRYGEKGLEQDPTRQQIIIYTMVVCQKHLLWYQRATPETVKPSDKKHLGDPRLQGRFSIGFGGHKTEGDIKISEEELMFLKDLLPAIKGEIAKILGLNHGFFNEVEEELGLKRHDVKDAGLLGAFYDARFEDPLIDIQVGWVHTGIAAILEVDPQSVKELTLRKKEIAKAWWVPYADVVKELDTKQKEWTVGKAPKVETWSEIMIREFWPDYLLTTGK